MNIGKTLNRATLLLRKHGPEILVVGGVVGTLVGGVMACKATTRLPEVKERAVARMESALPENDRKCTAKLYFQTGLDYVKLYAPAGIVTGLSVTGILAGNDILRKRNVALAAAYATLDTGYKQYRERVANRFGEEAERQIRYDICEKTVEEKVTNEDGKTKKVKKTIEVGGQPCEYARYFEQGASRAWEPSDTYNLSFLQLQQRLANGLLQSRGYLFLNEVYEMLGYDKTKAGQIVGWVYDPDNADQLKTDNYIDFRIQEIHKRDEGDGDEYIETILLDFNVDGPVLERASTMGLI